MLAKNPEPVDQQQHHQSQLEPEDPRVQKRLDVGREQQHAADPERHQAEDDDPMRPFQQLQLGRTRRGIPATRRDGGEIGGDRAAATGHETADVHELDPGTERRVIGVHRSPGLEQMAQHVSDSTGAS